MKRKKDKVKSIVHTAALNSEKIKPVANIELCLPEGTSQIVSQSVVICFSGT